VLIKGQSVNSGCYSKSKGLDDFCANTGCTHQGGNWENFEAEIAEYEGHGYNFVCKQGIFNSQGSGTEFQVAYSDEPDAFTAPSAGEEKETWQSPLMGPYQQGDGVKFSGLSGLNEDDTVSILHEDGSTACAYYVKDLENDQYYVPPIDGGSMFMLKLFKNYGEVAGAYPACPASVGSESRREKEMRLKSYQKLEFLHNYTVVNRGHHQQKKIHFLFWAQVGQFVGGFYNGCCM
jgi:hypothetical protein